MGELAGELNRLAGTTGHETAGAANVIAGTTGKELVGALNVAAGTTGLELNGVCKALAAANGGDPALDAPGCLATIPGTITGGGGGPPNLIAGVAWEHAYWASGTEFTALALADAAAVGTWPDEVGTANLTEVTNRPAYKATAGPNSKPTIDFASGTLLTATITSRSVYSVVMIGNTDDYQDSGSHGKARFFTTGANNLMDNDDVSYRWRIYQGVTPRNSTNPADNNPHLYVVSYGATDQLYIDGANVINADAGGAASGTTIKFGSASNPTLDGKLAFIGLYDGDARLDPGWTAWKSSVASFYGLTIA